MARFSPLRTDVIAEYAQEVLGLFPKGRVLFGVGGVERGQRQAFARDLASACTAAGVPSAAVPLDAFAADPEPVDPAALVDGAYDVDAFRRLVLEPYRGGESVTWTSTDPAGWTASAFEPGDRAALVVSGAFVHRPDLVGMWHATAWLRVSRSLAREREADRREVPQDDPGLALEFAAVDRFFGRVDARKRANATFDTTDPEHPRREFEDAC